MSRELTLSEEDLITLQKCLNEGIEPPQELAKKLFPSLYANYDFKTLKDSMIPTSEPGRRAQGWQDNIGFEVKEPRARYNKKGSKSQKKIYPVEFSPR
jgi:hypothetical protein